MKKIYQFIKQNFLYFLMAFVFLFMSIWSAITPRWTDDLMSITNGKPMNLPQITNAAVNEYFSWSGRVFGESIGRFLVSLPRPVFGVINGLITVSLIILMLLLATGTLKGNKQNNITILFALLLVFLLTPTFGQIFLWTMGNGNYLCTTIINLLFLYLFFNIDTFKINKFWKFWLYVLLIPITIIAGWSNETLGGGVLILLLGYYVINWLSIHKLNFNFKKLLLTVIYFVSYLFLLLAPGNPLRAKSCINGDYLNTTAFQRAAIFIPQVTNYLFKNYTFYLLLAFIILAVIDFYSYKNINTILKATVWELSGFATIYALVFSTGGLDMQGGRVFFPGFIFIVVGLLQLIPININSNIFSKTLIASSLISLLIFSLIIVGNGVIDSYQTNAAIKARYALIHKKIRKYGRNKTIKVPKLGHSPQTKYSVNYGTMWDLQPKQMNNQVVQENSNYEKAFGARKIVLKQ